MTLRDEALEKIMERQNISKGLQERVQELVSQVRSEGFDENPKVEFAGISFTVGATYELVCEETDQAVCVYISPDSINVCPPFKKKKVDAEKN